MHLRLHPAYDDPIAEGVADADAGASKRARRQSEHSAGQQGQGQAHGSQGGKRQQKERALAAFGSDNRCCLPGTLHRWGGAGCEMLDLPPYRTRQRAQRAFGTHTTPYPPAHTGMPGSRVI